jgi:probable phosphoglycerate mutase
MTTNPVTRVLLLRHAETAAPEVFHGAESDIGLSLRGLRQAQALAPILAAERPAAVVSSGMRRAIDTATPIAAACGVPLHVEPLLHERRVGGLSGRAFGAAPWPETLRRWMAGETGYAPDEHAESFDAVRDRVLPVWHRLAAQYAGQTYVVVAHGVVNKVILCSLGAGLGPADWNSFRGLNLAIHELVCEHRHWRIIRLAELPAVLREPGA